MFSCSQRLSYPIDPSNLNTQAQFNSKDRLGNL